MGGVMCVDDSECVGEWMCGCGSGWRGGWVGGAQSVWEAVRSLAAWLPHRSQKGAAGLAGNDWLARSRGWQRRSAAWQAPPTTLT